MYNYPQQIADSILDTVFPKVCLGCGKFTEKRDFDYLCRKCFGRIDPKNTFECIGCKRETRFGLTCMFCKKDNPIDQLIITAELEDSLVDKMLKTYKYKFVYSVSVPLSVLAKKCVKKLLSKNLNLFEDNPLLVPVPLSKKRLNWRGFNQAKLLAKNMSDAYHMSCSEDVLIRVADHKHQAEIKTREERLNNVINNFAVTDAEVIKNKIIILVDDICTTGATLNECARVLKGGGAKNVIGFVIARG